MTLAAGPTTDLDLVRAALDADYDVVAELGRGGMATVYRAAERGLDREVALKVLPFSLAHDGEFVERFQREAKTAAALEHAHIIPIYRVGRAGEVIYFAMKLLRGQSLSDRLAARGPLGAAEVRRMMVETASALGYAAKRGVVHRDVKPDNIMLEEDGRCVVTDFGIARSAAHGTLTAAGMSMGTPRYMSPEQARAKDVDGRSDLYALGVVAYECLTGRPPFDDGDAFAILMDHVSSPVPRPRFASDDERALYAVIERLLAKKPDDRFQSSDALIAALGAGATPSGAGAAFATGGGAIDAAAGRERELRSADARTGDDGGPRPSAALDRALAAGLDLLREQKPRVEAGVKEGVRVLREQQPKLAASLAASRELLEAQRPRGRRALERLRAHVSHRRRLWRRLGVMVALAVPACYGVHFVLKHRSRCVVPPAAAAAAHTMSLLVDPVGSVREGGSVDVYYDVCGLEKGTPFATRVSALRHESGLRRLLGGADPVVARLDGSASGPATRRHETLDLGRLPAGEYTLSVVVTDSSGRRRARSVDFVAR